MSCLSMRAAVAITDAELPFYFGPFAILFTVKGLAPRTEKGEQSGPIDKHDTLRGPPALVSG